MNHQNFGKLLFLVGVLFAKVAAEGWQQIEDVPWNRNRNSFRPDDSQVKDNWNNNNNNQGWSPGDSQSKEGWNNDDQRTNWDAQMKVDGPWNDKKNWNPDDAQVKDQGRWNDGFGPGDSQVKDSNWMDGGDSFGPGDSQRKDWNQEQGGGWGPMDSQVKNPAGWDGGENGPDDKWTTPGDGINTPPPVGMGWDQGGVPETTGGQGWMGDGATIPPTAVPEIVDDGIGYEEPPNVGVVVPGDVNVVIPPEVPIQTGDRGDMGGDSQDLFPPRQPQGNYKGGDSSGAHPGDDPSQWRIEDSIPGTPGVDYPNYNTIPATSFDCKQHENPGYYGDVEARCQVFHICQSDGRHDAFLCPLGTIFNQQYFVCVWWFNYNCDDTAMFYALNADLYKGGHGAQGNFKGSPELPGAGQGGPQVDSIAPPGVVEQPTGSSGGDGQGGYPQVSPDVGPFEEPAVGIQQPPEQDGGYGQGQDGGYGQGQDGGYGQGQGVGIGQGQGDGIGQGRGEGIGQGQGVGIGQGQGVGIDRGQGEGIGQGQDSGYGQGQDGGYGQGQGVGIGEGQGVGIGQGEGEGIGQGQDGGYGQGPGVGIGQGQDGGYGQGQDEGQSQGQGGGYRPGQGGGKINRGSGGQRDWNRGVKGGVSGGGGRWDSQSKTNVDGGYSKIGGAVKGRKARSWDNGDKWESDSEYPLDREGSSWIALDEERPIILLNPRAVAYHLAKRDGVWKKDSKTGRKRDSENQAYETLVNGYGGRSREQARNETWEKSLPGARKEKVSNGDRTGHLRNETWTRDSLRHEERKKDSIEEHEPSDESERGNSREGERWRRRNELINPSRWSSFKERDHSPNHRRGRSSWNQLDESSEEQHQVSLKPDRSHKRSWWLEALRRSTDREDRREGQKRQNMRSSMAPDGRDTPHIYGGKSDLNGYLDYSSEESSE